MGNFAGILRVFRTHKRQAQEFRAKIRSIFRKKIRNSIKIFRASFALQTCHLNHFPWKMQRERTQKRLPNPLSSRNLLPVRSRAGNTKDLFLQTSSDILKPPFLETPFPANQMTCAKRIRNERAHCNLAHNYRCHTHTISVKLIPPTNPVDFRS